MVFTIFSTYKAIAVIALLSFIIKMVISLQKPPKIVFGLTSTAISNKKFTMTWVSIQGIPEVLPDESQGWSQVPYVKSSSINPIGTSVPDNSDDLLFDSLYQSIIISEIIVYNQCGLSFNVNVATRDTVSKTNPLFNIQTLVPSVPTGSLTPISYKITPPYKYSLNQIPTSQQSNPDYLIGGVICQLVVNNQQIDAPINPYSNGTFVSFICEVDFDST